MEKYNVLITGIGGNVGQGVLRNLRAIGLDLRLVGCNVTACSAGNHLCDAVYVVPYAFDPGYIQAIQAICEKENIQLLLPCTDYEVYYLSLQLGNIPAALPVSEPETNRMFLDKYNTWEQFNRCGIPFASSVLPSEYRGQFKETIVKPREGRGSRGIQVNPADWRGFSDEYMIQEKHNGTEITTAFYVKKDGGLHGMITFARELQAGATSSCEVRTDYDQEMAEIINKMQANFPIKGACNVQAIVDQTSGRVVPFEINGRISGTNSIRSQFGFKDVQYLVEEYLLGREPEAVHIRKGSAVRILMDVIYLDIPLSSISNKHDRHYLY